MKPPNPAPKSGDAKPKAKPAEQKDLRNTDLLALAAPCKEDEENTARLIKVDNEWVAQFCKNRKWGNPYVEASSFKCRSLGFRPYLTEDKTGVSCRNIDGEVVSLETRWYPAGEGLELCNPAEYNLWFDARDREGRHIALRCDETGRFDGRTERTKFACNDPDRAYKTTRVQAGAGVACLNDQGITSLLTYEGANTLTNSNCVDEGKWVLYKARTGRLEAAKCEAQELPAPGLFLNLSSPDGTFRCNAGEIPAITEDGQDVSCVAAP
jgi:hypothetical protein